MSSLPDTTDWTFVLRRPCPECGFAPADVDRAAIADVLRDSVAVWPDVLRRADAGTRPRPDVWSPLEYACHVRDVLRLWDERLRRMLAEDDPLLPSWDQDEAAVVDRYAEQDPAQVSAAIEEVARPVAERLTGLSGEQWERPGRRSDGATFTVESMSRYFLHEAVHHAHDVRPRPERSR